MVNKLKSFHAKTRKEWRQWLEKNHASEKAVQLVISHKSSEAKSIYYEDAVLEALCFGWIDGRANKRDEESFYILFTPRKPKSNWSKLNRQRVAELSKQGLMAPAGQAMIDLAKKTGTWEALMDIENGIIPDELQKLFDSNPEAFDNFNAFAPSSRKLILQWIMDAKRPETRQKRIEETVTLAGQNIKAHHPKK